MRTGFNPHKDQPIPSSEYLHQIIIPVFIPHFEGYFKDSFAVLKLCLESVFATVHDKTFISVVNNGSCNAIKEYLNELYSTNQIQEVIHTSNIGKLNSILKGLAGNGIELVTISDSDVLFLQGWQEETIKIYKNIPKVGVVGIVPQFNMHKVHSFNLLFDMFFSNKVKFLPVKNKDALVSFYDSIGWDRSYNHDYLKYTLGLVWNDEITVLVGSGHFVATYKKDIFTEIVSNIPFKMGGTSEHYLDQLPLKKDYWRVTTYDNFAHHIGNTLEEWVLDIHNNTDAKNNYDLSFNFKKFRKVSKLKFIIKTKIFQKLFKRKAIYKLFLKYKRLPLTVVNKY